MQYPRGDKQWGRHPNKKDCPKDRIPLWQALNPFTLHLSNTEKYLLEEYIASYESTKNDVEYIASDESTKNDVLKSSNGRYYVRCDIPEALNCSASTTPNQLSEQSIKDYRGRLLNKFRRRVLRALPSAIREKIPEHIKEKYTRPTGFVSLKEAIRPFRIPERDHRSIYKIIRNTASLKIYTHRERHGEILPHYVPLKALQVFRKALWRELPEEHKELLPERTKQKFTTQPTQSLEACVISQE